MGGRNGAGWRCPAAGSPPWDSATVRSQVCRGKFPPSVLITKPEEASGKSFKPWAPPALKVGAVRGQRPVLGAARPVLPRGRAAALLSKQVRGAGMAGRGLTTKWGRMGINNKTTKPNRPAKAREVSRVPYGTPRLRETSPHTPPMWTRLHDLVHGSTARGVQPWCRYGVSVPRAHRGLWPP